MPARDWRITVPTLVRDGELLALSYDEHTGEAVLDMPYQRSLRDVDEARVWQCAVDISTKAAGAGGRTAHRYESADVERAYMAGYRLRVGDELRASARIRRAQLGAIVRVTTGWPLFDERHPFLRGGS